MPRKPDQAGRPSPPGKLPKPPKVYQEFVGRFPALARAWDAINDAGAGGPLDPRTRRLVKIAASMGAMREGAVRSGVRKARAEGISLEEIEQLVPLVAGTIGLPPPACSPSARRSKVPDILGRRARSGGAQ